MRQRGFTLLELMIVVALIALILAIAVPGYQDAMRKTRRTQAQGCLTERAQFLERFYATHLAYDADADGNAPPATSCSTEATDFYDFADTELEAASFELTATPKGSQDGDACGAMTLDQAGVKTADRDDCWK